MLLKTKARTKAPKAAIPHAGRLSQPKAAMLAGSKKMPEPIMLPNTSELALQNPSLFSCSISENFSQHATGAAPADCFNYREIRHKDLVSMSPDLFKLSSCQRIFGPLRHHQEFIALLVLHL